MPENHFDGPVAAGYDAATSEMFDAAVLDPTVDFLAELAGDGAALELGIGTGRVALPLSRRGVQVTGIELSPAMADQVRAKPGGDQIDVVIGDFATSRVPGEFRLAYLVFNTITNLTTQDEQVACFCNVAAHLQPGGCFVIEVGVPDLRRLPPGQTLVAFSADATHAGVDEYTDLVGQVFYSHHYYVGSQGTERFSAPYRYVWPSELDLMARLAGMTLVERWAGWTREPFTGASTSHVSVWQKPD